MKVSKKDVYTSRFVYGTVTERGKMAKSLAKSLKMANGQFDIISYDIKWEIAFCLLKASPEWAYAVQFGKLNVYIGKNGVVSLSTCGVDLGDIKFPTTSIGCTSKTVPYTGDERDYFGDEVVENTFFLK